MEHQLEVRVRGLSKMLDGTYLEVKLIDMSVDSSQVLCRGATGVPPGWRPAFLDHGPVPT